MTITTSEVTLPAYWASALINDDWSGLDETEALHCQIAVERLAAHGMSVVSDVEDSQRFTWYYRLYNPLADCEGGDVLDYLVFIKE